MIAARINQLVHTAGIACLLLAAGTASAQVVTTPTMNGNALKAALGGTGMTINSVIVRNGQPGQIGTFGNFEILPATIRPGIVLSSGDVTSLGPLAEVLDPAYDPSGPPAAVNSQMDLSGNSGGTSEFDAFGLVPGNIENFSGSFDVAAIEVQFTLDTDSQVQFDFIFGSVEFPVYTSSYTDAFLVFLDGTDPASQITHDHNGIPVQVGRSFAGLEITTDRNTAFAAPHAMIHHLTTTTAMLNAGSHTLIFEVGDVNDHILDSAVFLSSLRTGAGTEGTDPTDDNHGHPSSCGLADIVSDPTDVVRNPDNNIGPDDLEAFVNAFLSDNVGLADLASDSADTTYNPNGQVGSEDIEAFVNSFIVGCP